jgi:hypothetical protein
MAAQNNRGAATAGLEISSLGPLTVSPCLLALIIFSAAVWIRPALADDKKCPPITLGGGSPLYPQRTKGENITMYRDFLTEGDTNGLKISWFREPSSLSSSTGRYRTNNTLSKGGVRASIRLWHLMLFPDVGSYTVTVCSNCTCNKTTFILQLFKCDPSVLPQPLMQYRKTSIADPGPTVLYIYAVFNGSTSTFFYPTDWTHNGKDICIEGARPSSKFSCNRTLLGNCTFSANLYIYGYSSRDSGNYTVQAIGSGVASRNATICVDIFSESQVRSHSSERQYRPSAGYTVSTALSKQKQKSTGDRYRYLDVCAVGVALLLMVTTVSLSLVYFFKPAIHAYKEKSSETFPGFSPYLQSGSDIHKDFVLPNRTVECDNLEKKLSHVSKVIGPQSPKLVHGLGLSDRHSYPTEIEQLKFEVLLRWQLGPSSRQAVTEEERSSHSENCH